MADWHKLVLKPATFRGVPFFVEASEVSIGRQTVQHVYPFKEKEPAYSEDVGRKPRGFTVEGYVVGTEYMVARDRLMAALEVSGPGELVHPYHGTRRVAVTRVHVRETVMDGGMAKFSVDFDETQASPAQPASTQDAVGQATASAAATKAAAGAEFTSKSKPGSLMASVAGAVGAASGAVDVMLRGVALETQALAKVKALATALAANAATLVETPAALLAAQVEIFETISAALLAAPDVLNPAAAMLKLYAFDAGTRPPATTPNRLAEQTNFDACRRLTQRLVLVEASLLAVAQTYASYDEAIATQTAITSLLDEQAEVVADSVYPTLLQLRADLVTAVPGLDRELARLVNYTPPTNVPSLVLAHRLYGDVAREADLVSRNRIANPCFVTGGVELEVLSK